MARCSAQQTTSLSSTIRMCFIMRLFPAALDRVPVFGYYFRLVPV